MKKRLYKKGGKEMLMSIGGVVLAAAVILIGFYIILKLSGMFATPEDQATMASYNRIISRISRMKHKTDAYYIGEKIPKIQISGENTFVGFNKDEDNATDACHPVESIPKPAGCGKYACLCRYNPGHYEDFIYNKLKQCTPLPGVDYIFTLNYAGWYYKNPYKDYGVDAKIYKNLVGGRLKFKKPAGYPDDAYSYLFMYGYCDGWSWDRYFNNQPIYLEKFYDIGTKKTYILIAAHTPELEHKRRGMFEKIVPEKPDVYLAIIKKYCDNKTGVWWNEVEFNAEKFLEYYEKTADNKTIDYVKKCLEDARAKIADMATLIKQDIEAERKTMPPPPAFMEELPFEVRERPAI